MNEPMSGAEAAMLTMAKISPSMTGMPSWSNYCAP
jgi:hypothetical protein